MKLKLALILLTAVFVTRAADEWKLPPETAKFRPGPKLEVVVANCSLCHSADYISTQPPLSRKSWQATVDKMRLKYGAPIVTNNVDAIVTYLTTTYGVPDAK
jgi:sulfite dehydrogenase (cytochrome) subunit B